METGKDEKLTYDEIVKIFLEQKKKVKILKQDQSRISNHQKTINRVNDKEI
jgi:hypothetical protein